MRSAWGKTDSNTGAIHPLAHHSMDVAAVLMRMLTIPVIRERLYTTGVELTDVHCQRLGVLAFIHDIGKLHAGFQAKGWPEEFRKKVRTCGHTQESWSFLQLAQSSKEHPFNEILARILEWGDESVVALISAMFSHHGRPVIQPTEPHIEEWDRACPAHYDWRYEASLMNDAALHWFPKAFKSGGSPFANNPKFHHLIAGLAALADWIGSDRQFFDYKEPFFLGYDETAHRQSREALEGIGIDTGPLENVGAPDFHQLTGFKSANPAQNVIGNLSSDEKLVILEAETGSGKTESALWRFTQLLAAGKVSGLYFAVPTRAAAKQLHTRVQRILERVYKENAPEAVLAIPGMLKAGDYEGQRLPHWQVRWDDEGVKPQRWAAEHATRFLAAPVAVGTVDQAMLASLKVKHAHLRGSALSRSLLVIDEVHASDAYMTRILKKLLEGHLSTGGYAMLMSATLGSEARAYFMDHELPSDRAARNIPYPAIWVMREKEPQVARKIDRRKQVQTVSIPTMSEETTAELAVEAASNGGRVLVIRNTVDVAIKTWTAIRRTGGESLLMKVGKHPALHHSRFAAEDRVLLDEAVEASLAPSREREEGGCIVIGTQTLEQSLDIDADVLITDLCPIDVLLQRIGRLHRHEISRLPSFDNARAYILMPEVGLDRLSKCQFENGLGAWRSSSGEINGIYMDLACLELTRKLIDEQDFWVLPDMNRELVEAATHPECLMELMQSKDSEWERYHSDIGGKKAAERMVAELNGLDRNKEYLGLRFPSIDETVMTRLGEDGLVLSFEEPTVGPFDTPVTKITLPAHWSKGINQESKLEIENRAESKSEMILKLDKNSFFYSRAGLQKKII